MSDIFLLYWADSPNLVYPIFGELSSCFKCDSPGKCVVFYNFGAGLGYDSDI